MINVRGHYFLLMADVIKP